MSGGAIKDFAKGALAAGIAAGATSLTVGAGEGGKFPAVFNFLVVIWNATDFPANPEDDPSVEVLTVTNRVGDVCTITACVFAHNTGGKTYKIILAPVKDLFLGAANQLLGMDSAAGKIEHKTLVAAGPAVITHAAGTITLDALTPKEDFRGVHLLSPVDQDATKIMLVTADWITLDNGRRVTPAPRLLFDKDTVGAGGMQSAAVLDSWNRLFYIRKSSDGTEALFGQRAKDYFNDVSFVTTTNAVRNLRLLTGTATDKLAQGVQFATPGKHELAEFEVIRVGAVVGNIWWSLQASSGGDADGVELARTDKYDAGRLPITALKIRIPFRTPFTETLGTQYHWVMEGDYAKSDTVFIGWRGVAAGGYANGVAREFNGTTWANALGVGDFNFTGRVTRNDTAISPPVSYDRHARIGWFYIDGGGNIKRFSAHDRRIICTVPAGGGGPWKIGTLSATLTLFDLAAFIPPGLVTVTIGGGSTTLASIIGGVGPLQATDMDSTAISRLAAGNGGKTLAFATGEAFDLNAPQRYTDHFILEYQGMMGIETNADIDIWVSTITW